MTGPALHWMTTVLGHLEVFVVSWQVIYLTIYKWYQPGWLELGLVRLMRAL